MNCALLPTLTVGAELDFRRRLCPREKKNPLQLGSPNLTDKCSTMNPRSALILGSKGQGHKAQKTVPPWVL